MNIQRFIGIVMKLLCLFFLSITEYLFLRKAEWLNTMHRLFYFKGQTVCFTASPKLLAWCRDEVFVTNDSAGACFDDVYDGESFM
jgi:hypothetical protein